MTRLPVPGWPGSTPTLAQRQWADEPLASQRSSGSPSALQAPLGDALAPPNSLLKGSGHLFDDVLNNSEHIQAILNWPGNPKATYRQHTTLSADPHAWYSETQKHEGSWWPKWLEWIQAGSGEQRETLMVLGNREYPPLHAAPGTYVRRR